MKGKKGTSRGGAVAEQELARLHAEGSQAQGLVHLTAAARGGDAEAMLELAKAYHDGLWGVKKDKDVQFRWMKAAADAGHGEAMARLSSWVAQGIGCAANPAASQKWGKRAWRSGDDCARGICLAGGLGVDKDAVKGFEYYLKAAVKGNFRAQHDVALWFCDSSWSGQRRKESVGVVHEGR
jgi:TPR repeat protein